VRVRAWAYVGSGGLDVEIGLLLEVGVDAERAVVRRGVLALLQHHVQPLRLPRPTPRNAV
jgi:hypothetical protein